MTDYYRVSANVTTRRGAARELAVCVSESDTEVMPEGVKQMHLMWEIRRLRMKLAGPIKVEVANKDGSAWDRNQGPHDAHYWAWRMKDYPRHERPNVEAKAQTRQRLSP